MSAASESRVQHVAARGSTPAGPPGAGGDGSGEGPSLSTRRRVGRFGVVAALNALVDLGVFTGLVLLRPDPGPRELAVLSGIAVVAALVHSYVWNSRWTFGDRAAGRSQADRRAQRLRFAVQGGVNLGLGAGVVWIASIGLDAASVRPPVVADTLAKLLSMATASTASYLLMRHLVFRGRGSGSR